MPDNEVLKVIKEQGFKAFFDYASIGIIMVNSRLEILLANQFAGKIFGYESSELLGERIDILIPGRFHTAHESHREKYLINPQNRPMGLGEDLFGKRKDGSEFPVEISLGPYKLNGDVYIISFISDITVRKSNEDSIVKLNEELERKVLARTEDLDDAIKKLQRQVKETEAARVELTKSLDKEKELNTLKSRFVSMASHEFRTPLSTITSSAYLLQKYVTTEDQPKREKHLERIFTSVNTLNDILEDFLSVGKIEEGKTAVKYLELNIVDILQGLINQISPILKKNQNIVYVHHGPELINTDPALLKHIVINLISNAIKFSNENSTIEIKSINTDESWFLHIQDQGIGISESDQRNLYERFFRGNNASHIQGTGLGLHIVAKYVQLMKGEIVCHSMVDKGSEFVVCFPNKIVH